MKVCRASDENGDISFSNTKQSIFSFQYLILHILTKACWSLVSSHSSVEWKVSFSNHGLKSHLGLLFLGFLLLLIILLWFHPLQTDCSIYLYNAFSYFQLFPPSYSYCLSSPIRYTNVFTSSSVSVMESCHCTFWCLASASRQEQLLTSCHHLTVIGSNLLRDQWHPWDSATGHVSVAVRLALAMPFRPKFHTENCILRYFWF